MRASIVLLVIAALGAAALYADDPAGGGGMGGGEKPRKPDPGCISCHDGLEVMHPWEPLSCTECHGGDGEATDKEKAHVKPTRPTPNDERTVPLKYDLDYRRFVNPADLRVVDETCGMCHADDCATVRKSLHGTTSGHLSDGLYENGVTRSRTRRFSIFPVRDEDGDTGRHGYSSLPALAPPAISGSGDIGEHFADLPRKSCMQCHLYSRGVGVRGRLGLDGWYRSEGCAACHVLYSHDGLSRSADRTIDRLEPGHPIKHQLTSRIPTETCTTCHALDANIGMSFRGLAQLPPGVPGGPDVPGTTDRRSKGRFFLKDRKVCPPDIHHERGMHCIDCHGVTDVMGDGNIYGVMEHGVEVHCNSCHGTFEAKATFRTRRGEKLRHLFWDRGQAWLIGKLDGKKRRIKQVVDVLDRKHPDHKPAAIRAMDPVLHGRVECYACHSGWSVNFFGFHFDRNESFTQLDILSGQRTPGRVTTNEKMFATFRNFYLGWDSEGRVAPYMVAFSTAGSFHDKDGKTVLRHALPETAAGLSGMTMIHHQLHTVRPAARRCNECHGAPSVLGMGSENFRLFRDMFVAVGDAGLTVCGLDVKNPDKSLALANLPLPSRPRHVALSNDPVQGRAQYAYVACRNGSVQVVDVSDPVSPRRAGALDLEDARRVHVREGYLFVAAGKEGLVIATLSNPAKPRVVARVRTVEARAVHVDGLYAYVADGPGGLRVVDVSVPAKPAVVASVDTNGANARALEANDVLVHLIAGRPDVEARTRTAARNVAFVADGAAGLHLVDVTRPGNPRPMKAFPAGGRRGFRGTTLAFASNYEIGSDGGDIPSREVDYLYLVGTPPNSSNGQLLKIDVSDPQRIRIAGTRRTVDDPRAVRIASVYQAPFLKQYAVIAGRGRGNVELVDVTGIQRALPQAGVINGVGPAVGLDIESVPLDRLVGFDGKPLKDVSHEGARLFTREEIARILRVQEGEMNMRMLCGVVLVAAVLFAADKIDEIFAIWDANGDGILTPEELPDSGIFKKVDADGDGKATRAEVARFLKIPMDEPEAKPEKKKKAARKAKKAEAKTDGGTRKAPRTLKEHVADFFRRYDANKDGKVQKTEFRAGEAVFAVYDGNKDEALSEREVTRYVREQLEAAKRNPRPDNFFELFDRNRDDKVTRSEYDGPAEFFRRYDHNRDRVVTREEMNIGAGGGRAMRGDEEFMGDGPTRAPKTGLLERYDKNGDKRITLEELNGAESILHRLDRNGDGVLSGREVR